MYKNTFTAQQIYTHHVQRFYMYKQRFISVVIPALDEEQAIGKVIAGLHALTHEGNRIIDSIVVCDNGSSDHTAQVASSHGAHVVNEPIAGYGRACLKALKQIDKQTDIIVFIDGDHSCHPKQAIALLDGIISGDDLAIGSRPLGHIQKGALTPVQLFGNALSAKLIYLLWRVKITDLGPFRAITHSALKRINMQDKTFGWTVEMQVKAIQHRLTMNEYPVDSILRIGESKISGTIKGSIMAGIGILSMIFGLYFKGTKNTNT